MDMEKNRTLNIVHNRSQRVSQRLWNMLRDTSAPVLVYLSAQYGLRRLPGLSRDALVERLLAHLPPEQMEDLEDRLIAARYGSLDVGVLLELMLDSQHSERAGSPRLEDMRAENARLTHAGQQSWAFTMHGHDVMIDLPARRLACGCEYFKYASHRRALCKHLARALILIPGAYAREVLIDLLVTREYGGPDTPQWTFEHYDPEPDQQAA